LRRGVWSYCVSRITTDLNSLAAESLQQMGMLNATDIVGGYEAWKDAGLPVTNEPQRRKPRSLASLAGSVV
jgi:3-mercaptopyruvate sulfurtransferase SseA